MNSALHTYRARTQTSSTLQLEVLLLGYNTIITSYYISLRSWVVCCSDEKGKWDELIEERGVRILIEPAALMHVIGTTMDFVEDRIKCAQLILALRLRSGSTDEGICSVY